MLHYSKQFEEFSCLSSFRYSKSGEQVIFNSAVKRKYRKLPKAINQELMVSTLYQKMKNGVLHLPKWIEGNKYIRLHFNLLQPIIETGNGNIIFLDNGSEFKPIIIF